MFQRWLQQSVVYLGIALANKVIVAILMIAPFWVQVRMALRMLYSHNSQLGRAILSLFSFSRKGEAMFALLIAPVVLSVRKPTPSI